MRPMILGVSVLVLLALLIDQSKQPPAHFTPKPILVRTYNGQGAPQVDLAPELRQKNWSTPRGGSCVHATLISLLRIAAQAGNPELSEIADEWKETYGGGESLEPLIQKMEEVGLKYIACDDADVELLEWAIGTRRGAGVTWGGAHCVALVGLTSSEAIILDNNQTGQYKRQSREAFLREWSSCGGWGFALVYDGLSPAP